jgi:DNA modification methylase
MSDAYDAADDLRKSYDVCIAAMGEKLRSFRREHIGDATLYLGDCREILDEWPPCFRVDALVCDPPYGVGFKYASHDDSPAAYEGGYDAWLWGILEAGEAHLMPGSPVFVWQASLHVRKFASRFPREWRLFCAAKNFVQMRPTAMQFAYDPVIAWWTEGDKWSAGTASRDFHVANTAPVIATPENLERGHPCPRPLDQVRHIVEQWVRPDSTCLDPFMGSGTTGVACAKLGRKFIGIEIEPKYFDIACKRIDEAYRQPRLFKDEAPKPKQEAFAL